MRENRESVIAFAFALVILLAGVGCTGCEAVTGPGAQKPNEMTPGNPADVFVTFARPLEELRLPDTVTVTAIVVDDRRNVITDSELSWELRDTDLNPQTSLGSIVQCA
ncbi:MAG: hypothetical protein ABI681_06160 [Gemmatimonadales bacterium]